MLDRPSPRPLKTLHAHPSIKAEHRIEHRKLDVNRLKHPTISFDFNKAMNAALDQLLLLLLLLLV